MQTPSFRELVAVTCRLYRRAEWRERFLRQLDVADLLHAFLTVFLFLQQLFLTADVTAVAFRQHVFTQLLHGGTRDDVRADRRLNRDVELLTRDQIFHLLHQFTAAILRVVAVGDQSQRIHALVVDQHVHAHHVGSPKRLKL